MNDIPSLFERYLTEAPGEDPPDMPAGTGPPDMPDDAATQGGPPDMGDLGGGDAGGDDAGDMPDMGGLGGDEGGDDGGFGAEEGQDGDGQQGDQLQLDDKVDAIMNQQLYQRFLALLNKLASQLTMIKNNSDVLYTLSPESLDVIENLKKLDENVRLYIKNSFMNENYSKNLLFFNKCLNLLKLLNDLFDANIRKGIKDMK